MEPPDFRVFSSSPGYMSFVHSFICSFIHSLRIHCMLPLSQAQRAQDHSHELTVSGTIDSETLGESLDVTKPWILHT